MTREPGPEQSKRRLTIELDDETFERLAKLGSPVEVLTRLAESAASGAGHPLRPLRSHTDQSLRAERGSADSALETLHQGERRADDEVKIARRRADERIEGERADSDRLTSGPSPSTTDARSRADALISEERLSADAKTGAARAKHPEDRHWREDRGVTDRALTGERAKADSSLVDQREANEGMVRATLRAQELTDEAEIARTRSEHDRRDLQEGAKFRELFIGMLGHDLRNPLASIVTSAGLLLQRGRLDARDAETVARIIRGSQRMSRMIAQVLDLTRARLGGGLAIERKPMDLGVACHDVVEEFPEAPLRLLADGDLSGFWDEDRLAQVLSNLIGNALQYASPGTPVTVEVQPDGAEVVVEVRNLGPPIPPDVLPFIFEPFRREKQDEKSASGSLGLGLYISRQVALSHGGTLEALSEGGTTTFTLRLPRQPRAGPGPEGGV